MAVSASAIDHLGILVEDLDEAVGFLEVALELEVVTKTEVAAKHLRAAFMQWGPISVELIEVKGGPSVESHPVNHLAIAVADVGQSYDELCAVGAIGEAEPAELAGRTVAFVRLPKVGNALVQLLQKPTA